MAVINLKSVFLAGALALAVVIPSQALAGMPKTPHAPRVACTIVGTAKTDVLRSTAARDVICAGGGRDTIYAGIGDIVMAGPGDDVVYATGYDVILAGAGNDQIFARDGYEDLVDGGAGHDAIRADGLDHAGHVESSF
jgi:Ca2+-binding RTX toxin-like protein